MNTRKIDLQLSDLLDQIQRDTLKRATAVYYRVATYHRDGLMIRPPRTGQIVCAAM